MLNIYFTNLGKTPGNIELVQKKARLGTQKAVKVPIIIERVLESLVQRLTFCLLCAAQIEAFL